MSQEYPPPVPPYKDNKSCLVGCGVGVLIIGLFCALMVPLMWVSSRLVAATQSAPKQVTMIPSMVSYGLYAFTLVWLGIGSIMARRWARALLLILAWSGLVIGLMVVPVTGFVEQAVMTRMVHQMPASSSGQPELPAAAATVGVVFMVVFMGIFLIVLPLIGIVVYGSKNSKATCEAHDPVERWTDRCPLQLVAASVWLMVGAVFVMVMPIAYPVFPFFGKFLTGAAGCALYLILAASWVYASVAIYKVRISGWWVAFLAMSLFCVSGFITYLHHDIVEIYQLMGFPEEQIAQVKSLYYGHEHVMAWIALGGAAPWLIYLLFVLRYFRQKEQSV